MSDMGPGCDCDVWGERFGALPTSTIMGCRLAESKMISFGIGGTGDGIGSITIGIGSTAISSIAIAIGSGSIGISTIANETTATISYISWYWYCY